MDSFSKALFDAAGQAMPPNLLERDCLGVDVMKQDGEEVITVTVKIAAMGSDVDVSKQADIQASIMTGILMLANKLDPRRRFALIHLLPSIFRDDRPGEV